MTARTDPESFRDRDLHELHAHEAAAEPVGLEEIASRLGRPRDTVDKWRARGVMPDPEPTTVGGRPWWRWGVIEQWARDTGRLSA